MIIIGIIAIILVIVCIVASASKDCKWLATLILMPIGLGACWWDISSPAYTETQKHYYVIDMYEDLNFNQDVIISKSIHNRNGRNWGSITKYRVDTTYEFIKFYENGDIDKYENISKF